MCTSSKQNHTNECNVGANKYNNTKPPLALSTKDIPPTPDQQKEYPIEEKLIQIYHKIVKRKIYELYQLN